MAKGIILLSTLLIAGCATATTQYASLDDIKLNISKVDHELSPSIIVYPFDLSDIPQDNVGKIISVSGGIIKTHWANVVIENPEETGNNLAKAFSLLLENAGYKIINTSYSKQILNHLPTDIILESKAIVFQEDVESGTTLTASNRCIIKCSILFELTAKNAKTGEVLASRKCEGSGQSIAKNIRPLRFRHDFGKADVWTLLIRELDETGYFKKAEAIALITAAEQVFNDPAFLKAIGINL